MILDTKLDFQEHPKNNFSKISKILGILRKLQKILTRPPLLTIYKSFTRPRLDYGDIIYYKACNTSFLQNLEKIQYNSAFAIAKAIRGTSKEKLYQELGLESLKKDLGFANSVIFIRSLTSDLLHTILILFLCLADHTLQDTSKMFLVRHDFFIDFFFLLLQLNGTRLTEISENQKVKKKTFQGFHDRLKTEFID